MNTEKNIKTKNDIIDAVIDRAGAPSRRIAERYVNGVLDYIKEQVAAGNTVQITGWGKFEPVLQAGRDARNPQSGERMSVEAKWVVKFRPGAKFKQEVAAREA
ncbi:HU family DNA-binding protein [Nonomuraea sp. NPDC049480]|uniref:HU family DNA-binding protein n=1 Tax=Nonomuraea sp. NPDC049480 TaxID=3364353 RepID=UPI0037A5D538